jgi:hypothetical protein
MLLAYRNEREQATGCDSRYATPVATNSTPNPQNEAKSRAEAEKLAAEAAKVLAEARKIEAETGRAERESKSAAAVALAEAVKGPFTGEVSGTAGVLEGRLMAVRAVGKAAERIAAAVEEADPPPRGRVLVMEEGSWPSFEVLGVCECGLAAVEAGLRRAMPVEGPHASETAEVGTLGLGVALQGATATIAAGGLALEGISKLLGYFRTDYVVWEDEVKVPASVLLNPLANALRRRGYEVRLPGVHQELGRAGHPVLEKVRRLLELRGEAGTKESGLRQELGDLESKVSGMQAMVDLEKERAADLKKAIEALREEIAGLRVKEGEAESVARLEERLKARVEDLEAAREAVAQGTGAIGAAKAQIRQRTREAAELERAGAAAEAWVAKLDQGTPSWMARWMREDRILSELTRVVTGGIDTDESALVLLAGVEKALGGTRTKKHLFSGLTGLPMEYSGGAVVTYVCFQGRTGAVVAAGAMPVYEGTVEAENFAAWYEAE